MKKKQTKSYLLFNFNTMKWIILVLVVAILGIRFIRYRKRVIRGKIRDYTDIAPEEERELWYLAQKCLDNAEKSNVKLPRKNVAILRLDNDPYTWVIVQLGIVDKEIFRCRMSLNDVAEARQKAKEELEEK